MKFETECRIRYVSFYASVTTIPLHFLDNVYFQASPPHIFGFKQTRKKSVMCN